MSKKSSEKGPAGKTVACLDRFLHSCEICDRMDETMHHYIDVICYLYFKEDTFRQTFKAHKAFCLPHLNRLLKSAPEHLRKDRAKEFSETVLAVQIKNMQRLYDETDWFIKKFDYRYQNEPWKNSQDAVPRTIQKLVSYIHED